MHISNVLIKNFRAVADLRFDLVPRINVIVGPNAIGKTTILQALRLPKAILAPRTQNEATQVLISLGAVSPSFPQRLFPESLFRDKEKALEIRCTYKLSDEEIATLKDAAPAIVTNLVQSQFGQAFANPALLVQILNSPQGQQAQTQATGEIARALATIEAQKTIVLGLKIEPTGQIVPTDTLAPVFVGFLDGRLQPFQTCFSYFPADRALPLGQPQVQFGAADASMQLESHNSQPQEKYNRLKNTIFNTVIRGEEARLFLKDEFDAIFEGVLPGRKVVGPGINEIGNLSILVEEIETKRIFEMDNLSSGEKGLILTFLLIAQSVYRGGIVLLDEPELHLNPAVCKDVLPFLFSRYAEPNDLQFIVCSHSPEILATAFDRDEFALHHLLSETEISRVGRTAFDELSDALQKLGTSVSETLMYKGTLFVEGDDDVRLLEDGFPQIIRRLRLRDRGGRHEVEKTIEQLQALEKRGEKVDPIYFIFDRDRKPSDLGSSTSIKVLQWPRYCLENYLIDVEVLTSLFKDKEITRQPVQNSAEVERKIRELAFSQLDELAARNTYSRLGYLSASLRVEDVSARSASEMTEALFNRMAAARATFDDSDKNTWVERFEIESQAERGRLEIAWDATWKENCDGKTLFSKIHTAFQLKVPLLSLKRRTIQAMASSRSENWTLVESLLKNLVASG